MEIAPQPKAELPGLPGSPKPTNSSVAPRLDRGAHRAAPNGSGAQAVKRPDKGLIPENLIPMDEQQSAASAMIRAAQTSNAGADGQPKKTVAQVLGEIAWLMSQSPEHKHYSLADLEWLIMPPVILEQFRIYYHQGTPVACALWAYVTPETEEKLKSGAKRLRPEEWCGGVEITKAAQFKQTANTKEQPTFGQRRLVEVICVDHQIKEKLIGEILPNK